MDDDHVNDLPLNDRFVKCQQFVDSLDHSAAAATDETRVRTTCDALEYLTRQVATLSLFSANEHYAELNPAHIQYLLLPAYLGRLATLENDPSKRVNCTCVPVRQTSLICRCTRSKRQRFTTKTF
jgi:hypothetical protein